jgi:hypothetical protein
VNNDDHKDLLARKRRGSVKAGPSGRHIRHRSKSPFVREGAPTPKPSASLA